MKQTTENSEFIKQREQRKLKKEPCPKCNSKFYYVNKDGTHRCRHCGHAWKKKK